MNNLTPREKEVMDNSTRELDNAVELGTVIQDIINEIEALGIDGSTPVNAANATGILTIAGVVKHGETVTIGTDVYEFLADDAQTKSDVDNIAVSIVANSTAATGTLTIDTQPTSGDTMWIGTKIYTFVPDGTANAEGEVSIGTDLATAKANIVAAINGTDGHNNPSDEVSASDFVADICTITALVKGAAGNSIPTTETFTAGTNVFAAVTLLTGADCTATNGAVALVAAITASDTVGVGAVKGAAGLITLTADVAGIAANVLVTLASMVNGSFAAGTLTGGMNGTISRGIELKADATNLYVSIGQNGITDAKWRKIQLAAL